MCRGLLLEVSWGGGARRGPGQGPEMAGDQAGGDQAGDAHCPPGRRGEDGAAAPARKAAQLRHRELPRLRGIQAQVAQRLAELARRRPRRGHSGWPRPTSPARWGG